MSVAANAGTTAWSAVAPVVEAISAVANTVIDVFAASFSTPTRSASFSLTATSDTDPADATSDSSGTTATKSLVIPPAHSIQAHDPTSGQTIAVAQDAEDGSLIVEGAGPTPDPCVISEGVRVDIYRYSVAVFPTSTAARAVDEAEQGIPLQLAGFSEEESRAILAHSAIQRETEAFNEAQDQRLAQAARRMGELARAATAASEARRAATPSFWHDVAYLGENARHQIGQWAQSATRAAEDTGSPALAVVVAGVSHVGSAVLSAGTCVIDVPAAVRGGMDEFNTTVEVAQKYNVAVAASHLVGLRQISEAVYGVDILTLEEVDWAHKTAEAFGRLGGTAGALVGGLKPFSPVMRAKPFGGYAAPNSAAIARKLEAESFISRHAIDMTNAPASSARNALGFQRNGPWFWRQLRTQKPEMFSADNLRRIRNRQALIVDEAWVRHNPQHADFLGDKLIHHHIDQGRFASGLPESLHQRLFDSLHNRTTR